jgi:hypothetical protein
MNVRLKFNKRWMNTAHHVGGWPWPTYEHVQSAERTRFAKYPDGVEETATDLRKRKWLVR